MTRIAIVGVGFMGQTHLKNYRQLDGVHIAALCDIDPRRAAGDFTGTWGNVETAATGASSAPPPEAVTDYRTLLDRKDIDVIDVCVPTPVHAEVALAAIRAGKHVLCEKPLARTAEEARQVRDAAAKAPGFFMPAMCIRFWPQWAWAKKAVASGEYGRVRSATFTRLASTPPGWYQRGSESGGAILDLHVHDTDFVNFLFGPPQAVFSRGYAAATGEIDHLLTQYIYPADGPSVTAEGGWAMASGFGFRMRYTINFERATVDYDLMRDTPLLLSIGDAPAKAIDCPGGDGWLEELRYFTDCVRANRKPEVVTAADAVRAIEVIDAERQSIATGKVVDVRLS